MTFRHLEIFIAVADLGSMTRASRHLFISQPTVSQAIAELENHYGFLLFERFSRSLSITEQGKIILSYARHIQSLLGEMEQTSERLETSGLLRVGASMTIGSNLLPELIRQLSEKVPQAETQVVVRNTRDLETMLLKNQLDCALLEGAIHFPELLEVPFRRDSLALVCGKDHSLYQSPISSLKSLQSQSFLVREPGSGTRELFESVMASAEINWKHSWECGDSSTLVQAAEMGFGIGVISRSLVTEKLKDGSLYQLPLPASAFCRTFRLVYHKNKYITPLMKLFFHHILEKGEDHYE
jgi:DNA-binding transcriptional LysR family regulator